VSEEGDEQPQPHWDTDRVEAFSDGVFAIAITLLVLEITIEPDQYDHLARALVDEWPSYLAYITSFLTVGSVWIAHHSLFTHLRYVDPVLLRINLVLLLVAAFLPFPTAVMAQAFDHTARSERVAIVFYGGVALLMEVLLRSAIRYAQARPQLHMPGVVHGEPALIAPAAPHGWRAAFGTIVYGAAILVGIFLFPRLAAAAYLVVALRGVFVAGSEGRLSLRLRPR
jgi:uncharacterized membrane protein